MSLCTLVPLSACGSFELHECDVDEWQATCFLNHSAPTLLNVCIWRVSCLDPSLGYCIAPCSYLCQYAPSSLQGCSSLLIDFVSWLVSIIHPHPQTGRPTSTMILSSIRRIFLLYLCLVGASVTKPDDSESFQLRSNYVIVGGGPAGYVPTTRLSDDPNVTVIFCLRLDLMESTIPMSTRQPFLAVSRLQNTHSITHHGRTRPVVTSPSPQPSRRDTAWVEAHPSIIWTTVGELRLCLTSGPRFLETLDCNSTIFWSSSK